MGKNRSEKQSGKWAMPKLRIGYRILLYFSMILFATLSLLNVTVKCFSYIIGISIYVLAAVTLFTGIYYLVIDFRFGIKETVKSAIVSNPYVNKVAYDYRLRTVLFAVPGLMSNVLFAVSNGVTGIISRSAWFGSLATYYILLSMMRIDVVKEERLISRINGNYNRLKKEIEVYRKNSILFIFLAVVLIGMVILLETSQGGKTYPGFTIYAAAVYAFYKIIISSINVIKVRKQNSPLLTIIRRIGYIDACVSILTLQVAMFATFGAGKEMFMKIMNVVTGGIVCVIVLATGIQGICSSKKMKIAEKAGGNWDD